MRPLDHFDHLIPLRLRKVNAGRVVAAGVQHNDIPFRYRVETGQHGIEIQAVRCRVIVGVAVDLEPGELQQRAVILPARIADPGLGLGIQAAPVIRAHLETASTTPAFGR